MRSELLQRCLISQFGQHFAGHQRRCEIVRAAASCFVRSTGRWPATTVASLSSDNLFNGSADTRGVAISFGSPTREI
jgi:hypothetical protein